MSPRALMWSGIGLCVLAIVLFFVQFSTLQMLVVPWYQPVVSLVGAILVLAAFAKKRSIGGGIALVLTVGLTAFEAYGVGVMLRTPAFVGPTKGSPMPTFTTAYADGRPFTEKGLAGGQTSVLTFFRGRW